MDSFLDGLSALFPIGEDEFINGLHLDHPAYDINEVRARVNAGKKVPLQDATIIRMIQQGMISPTPDMAM